MAVFNDLPPNKKPKIKSGYGSAKKAQNTIKKLRKQPKQYQYQVAHTLYFRAKYHKYQTKGMRNAMKIYKHFLNTIKNNK